MALVSINLGLLGALDSPVVLWQQQHSLFYSSNLFDGNLLFTLCFFDWGL